MLRALERPIKADLIRALNRTLLSGNDWRRMARMMGYQSTAIDGLSQNDNPAEEIFTDWETRKESSVEALMALFDGMERDDLRQILEKSRLHQQQAVQSMSELPTPVAGRLQATAQTQQIRGVHPTPTYNVCVLLEGYSDATGPGTQNATGSSTLFKGPTHIVVDTGTPWDKHRLLTRLRECGIGPLDVGFVVCTHGHSDHVGNLNLFENATMIVSYDVSKGHSYTTFPFKQGRTYKINDYAEVIPTPGHTDCCVSVIIRDTNLGTVVAAGDLFECKDDLQQPRLWKDFSEHIDQQIANREKVLKIADWIIPGHGQMFQNHQQSGIPSY